MSALTRPRYPIPALLGLLLAGCATSSTTPSPGMVGMANPASVYCIKQGGQLLPQKDSAGNEFSLCQLADGRVIEEWALFRQQKQPPQP
ncbi:putative hemolysin [Aquitalea aquatilis]|uniref:putative hemolysin n=1 Tax=Aquitalea aquatilis TaxID=1537400 RepID=UPI0010BD8BB2|nr:DUF333 domain-containing protein [Aquitalea aquatilis]